MPIRPFGIPAMPELKFLDGVHKSSVVRGFIRGNSGVSRQVAHQPQQSREPRNAGVRVRRGRSPSLPAAATPRHRSWPGPCTFEEPASHGGSRGMAAPLVPGRPPRRPLPTTRSLRNSARSYFLDSWSKAKSKCFGFTLPVCRSEIYLITPTVSARSNFTAFASSGFRVAGFRSASRRLHSGPS